METKIKTSKNLLSTILVTLTFLALSKPTLAEEQCNCNGWKPMQDLTYLSFGGETLNLSALNSGLEKNNYTSFPLTSMGYGLGSRTFAGKVVTGADGMSTMESVVSNKNGYKGYLSSNFRAVLNAGYVVFENATFRVYPTLGLGVGSTNLEFFKDEKTLSFKDSLTKPDRGISISNTSIILDFAISADYVIGLGKSEKKKGGIAIGMKAGYVFSPYSFGFNLKGQTLVEAPSINNDGAYIKIFSGYTDGIVSALLDLF